MSPLASVARLIKTRWQRDTMRYAWLAFVSLVVTSSLSASIAFFNIMQGRHSLFADFTVFWTAARSRNVYDPVALTAAQMEWLPLGTTLRPFAYPPTALLFIKPLALLPYGVALGTWSTAGMMAISGAALLYGRRGLLGLASTPVGVALVAGQISLITGGCLAAAVAMLRRNEVVSGVLFGCLFVIKPQVALLVPVGLLAGRHFKAIGIAALPVAGGAVASLTLGPHLWLDWLGALPQFAKETATPAYGRMNIALGWHFAPFGIALVGFVFWRSTSPVYRLIALVCGTVLCVPYLMIYDLAAMSPAIAVLLLRPFEYFQAPDVQQTRLRTTMP